MDATNRVVAGWILEERLGSGGFGEVWRARRRHVDLFRALKLVPVADEDAFASWRHEISRLEELSHPNIVRFYDADIVGDTGPYQDFAWIATELCQRSLADELDRRPEHRLTPAETVGLLDAMLSALAAAHAQGCVHRDVKPANILLHASGVWKLCDFGTARLIPDGETAPRTAVFGTFPYMSPAAHRGRQDQAADLYALGVTVHEALCGERLHPRPPGTTDSEYVKLILDTPPAISPRLDPRWRGYVTALIGQDGPHTAAELLAWLRRNPDAPTALATPPPTGPADAGTPPPEGRGPSPWPAPTPADPGTPPPDASGPGPWPASIPADPGAPPSAGPQPGGPASPAGAGAGTPAPEVPGGSTADPRGTSSEPAVRPEAAATRRDADAPATRRRPPPTRRPSGGPSRGRQEPAHLGAIFVLIVGSLAVAGLLLHSLVPDPLILLGILGAALLVVVVVLFVS